MGPGMRSVVCHLARTNGISPKQCTRMAQLSPLVSKSFLCVEVVLGLPIQTGKVSVQAHFAPRFFTKRLAQAQIPAGLDVAAAIAAPVRPKALAILTGRMPGMLNRNMHKK